MSGWFFDIITVYIATALPVGDLGGEQAGVQMYAKTDS